MPPGDCFRDPGFAGAIGKSLKDAASALLAGAGFISVAAELFDGLTELTLSILIFLTFANILIAPK